MSAGSSVLSLPPSNVKTRDVRQVWRSDAGFTYLLADITQTLTLEYVAVINCLADTAWRVRYSTVDPTGEAGDAFDSGLVSSNWTDAERLVAMFVEPGVLGRYLRIDGLSEAGRLTSGQTFKPSRDMSFGVEFLWRDRSRRSESLDFNEFIDVKRKQKGYRFVLHGLTEDEAEGEVYTLNRINGSSRDIFVCRNKDATDLGHYSIWGTLAEPAIARAIEGGIYDVEFEVWQRI